MPHPVVVRRRSLRYGFTLIEILVVAAIALLLSAIVLAGFNDFEAAQSLDLGSRNIASFIDKARTQTLSGLGGTPYGIHLSSGSAVLFAGASYQAGAPGNETLQFPGGLQASSISLAGGGSDIIFDQLTGDTGEWGSFVLSTGVSGSPQKTIVVSSSGHVEVQ